MILSTKKISVVNNLAKLKISLQTKVNTKLTAYSITDLDCESSTNYLNLKVKTSKLDVVNVSVNKLDLIINQNFNATPNLNIVNLLSFTHKINYGWSLFSCPLDSDKAVMTHSYMPNYSIGDKINYSLSNNSIQNNTFMNFFQNNIYEFEDDEIPLFYKNEPLYKQKFLIVKDSDGGTYIPEYSFSGITTITQNTGYTLKVLSDVFFKIKAEKNPEINTISDYNISYTNGWIYVPLKTLKVINVEDFLKPYTLLI